MQTFNGDMKTVPAKAFRFEFDGDAFEKIDAQKRTVELKLYDGGITKHWYWGNLAFDLTGMKLAKERIGILYGHDTNTRLGFSTGADFKGAFRLTGELLDNDHAQAILSDGKAGFPFEASLRFDIDNFKARQILDGETATVNGNTLEGPGTVIEQCSILEGSICVLGALQNTDARFKLQADDDESGVVELKTQYPTLHGKVFDQGRGAGEKAERDLAASIFAACPNAALAYQCWKEGKTAEQAKMTYLEAENTRLQSKIETDPDAAATQEFIASDQSDSHDNDDDGDEMVEFCGGDKDIATRAIERMNRTQKAGRVNILTGPNRKKSFLRKAKVK